MRLILIKFQIEWSKVGKEYLVQLCRRDGVVEAMLGTKSVSTGLHINYRLHLVAMERWSDRSREMMEWREEARRIDLVMARHYFQKGLYLFM